MSKTTEEILVAKLESLEASIQDIKQTSQQASQDSQQAVQAAKQAAQDVQQVVGSLQSDFSSRTSQIVSDADSVKSDERMRATAGRGDSYIEYKMNVNDFDVASGLRSQDKDIRELSAKLNEKHLDLLQRSLDHYSSVLADERTVKYGSDFYRKSLKGQSLAHSDLAREDQWESDKEALVSAIVGEVVKSIQVPRAATEVVKNEN